MAAAGWLTALKLVPWRDVIEATPQILQSAKKLMGKTDGADVPQTSAGTAPTGTAVAPTAATLQAQLEALTERVAMLEREQRECAALIQSLAEQNAVVVRAVDALRLRTQRLIAALGVLGAALAAIGVWVLRHP